MVRSAISQFAAVETAVATDVAALTAERVTLHPETEAVNGFGFSIRYKATGFASSTSFLISSKHDNFWISLQYVLTILRPGSLLALGFEQV
jgi:hypothetical protein